MTDWLGNKTTFGYDSDGNLETVGFPSGTKETDDYSYDTAGELSRIEMKQGSSTMADLEYARDATGRVVGASETGLPQPAAPVPWSYAYDDANRVTTVAGVSGFEYDAAGELTDSPGYSYGYDARGDRTSMTPSGGSGMTATYDDESRLTQASWAGGGPTISYVYSADGLLGKTTSGATSTHLNWSHAGALPLLLTDGQSSYLYGPDDLPIEQLDEQGNVHFLHHDQLGSTRLVTDSRGQRAGAMTYTPYGRIAASEGTVQPSLGFAGQYTEPNTGFVYMRARFYDPTTAQFLTRDPLEEITGEPYAYAADDPVNASDPTGLRWLGIGGLPSPGQVLSALNPIPYFQREIEAYESGCGYWQSVRYGLEGTLVAAADAAGVGGLFRGIAGATAEEAPSLVFRSDTSHIFRDAVGHLPEDTPANRALLQEAVKPENFVGRRGPDGVISVYRQRLPDGRQVWVEVRNGTEITNGGVSEVPR